jgi:two-component system phosphate regulon response regulator OmpR
MSQTAASHADSSDKPHILVVDDDRRIRELLGRYLHQHDFIVSEAENAKTARQLLQLIRFEAVVLDIMMPGEDGLTLTGNLKRDGFATPILLLTAKGEAEARIAGFEAGADDYLPKPFEPRELVLRLQAILRRAAQVPVNTSRKVHFDGWEFDAQRNLLIKGSDTQPLTKAESTLLTILSQKPGIAFARSELAKLAELEGQERTIDVQVTRLRRKIEPDPKKPRFLQTVRGEGYVLFIDEEKQR